MRQDISSNNEKPVKIKQDSSELRRFLRVFLGRKVVMIGAVVLIVFILAAAFAPLISPYDPNKINMINVLGPMSGTNLLGTDSVGRDILSRIIYGSRTSFTVGVVAVGLATLVGMLLGLVAGYYGKAIDSVIMRIMDAIQAVPTILLALTISALLGGGIRNVIIAIGVSMVPGFARLMRSQVIVVKQHDYVVSSRVIGARNLYTMLKHITPNCFPPLIVQITMQVGFAILSEASLSFLGVGISPPTAAWGFMVSDGYTHLMRAPIVSVAPGLALMLVVFAFNMVGDGLRDALDPRLRGTM